MPAFILIDAIFLDTDAYAVIYVQYRDMLHYDMRRRGEKSAECLLANPADLQNGSCKGAEKTVLITPDILRIRTGWHAGSVNRALFKTSNRRKRAYAHEKTHNQAVAEMVGVNEITIRRWLKAGRGPAYTLTPTGFYHFGEDDVLTWLQSMKHEPGEAAAGTAGK